MIKNPKALILIDVQKGFLDESFWGKRNNPEFEENIFQLLNYFRKSNHKIIHVQHQSKLTNSPLRPLQSGVEFMDCAIPEENEPIFIKSVNSAFIGTDLENYLHQQELKELVLAGLTTDHCVSTSTRMAANLGFDVTLIENAIATFDREGLNKEIHSADLVHRVSLASLKGEFAKVTLIKEYILASNDFRK